MEALRATDRRLLDLAELLLATLQGHPSPRGFEEFRSRMAEARTLATEHAADPRVEPGDARFTRHLISTWNLLDAVVRRRFDSRSVPVETILERLTGRPDAIGRLAGRLRSSDPDRWWRYLEARARARSGRIPADHESVRDAVSASMEAAVEAFRDWLAERELYLPGVDAEVVIGSSTNRRSFYEPRRHRVVLDADEIVCRQGSEGPSVDPTFALSAIAHELGHAVQATASCDLPEALQPDDRPQVRYAVLAAAEGFAGHFETLVPDFLRESGAELLPDGADPELPPLAREFAPHHFGGPALAMAVGMRVDDDPSRDGQAELHELVGHPGFGESFRDLRGEPLNRLIYQAACFFGREMYSEIHAGLRREGVPEPDAWKALARGAWAPDLLEEAVRAEVSRRIPRGSRAAGGAGDTAARP